MGVLQRLSERDSAIAIFGRETFEIRLQFASSADQSVQTESTNTSLPRPIVLEVNC